jgi:hypothetical protein
VLGTNDFIAAKPYYEVIGSLFVKRNARDTPLTEFEVVHDSHEHMEPEQTISIVSI